MCNPVCHTKRITKTESSREEAVKTRTKRDAVTRDRRELHSEILHNLHTSPNITVIAELLIIISTRSSRM